MTAEWLALAAAFCYATGNVAVKLGTRNGDMMLGFMVSLVTGLVAVWVVALVTVDSWSVAPVPAVLFALSGIMGPGVARLLSMRGVRDAGTSVSVPVQSSTAPVLASAAGVVLFGETVGVARALAITLIVTGIWACAWGGSANLAKPRDLNPLGQGGGVHLPVLLFPIGSGAVYATADVMRKAAVTEHPEPVLGVAVGMTAAFVVWVALFLFKPRFRAARRLSPSIGWFFLNGLLGVTAQVCLFIALRTGGLSVIAPIIASRSVMVIILGALALRDLERLRFGTVAGAIVVSVGVAYLSIA